MYRDEDDFGEDVFIEDEDFTSASEIPTKSPDSHIPDTQTNFDFTSFLKSNSIPTQLTVEENGEEKTINFSELSDTEKVEYLRDYFSNESEYSESEKAFIQQLRQNNQTVEEYFQNYRDSIINEFSPTPEIPLSDEELFIGDLVERYPNLSEEEIAEMFKSEKANTNLYNKKLAIIKESVAQKINERQASKQQESFEAYQAKLAEHRQTLKQVAENPMDFGLFSLEKEDMDEIVNFTTGTDFKGQSYLEQTLSNPKALLEMMWFHLTGKDALNKIQEEFNTHLNKSVQEAYQRGLKDGKSKP